MPSWRPPGSRASWPHGPASCRARYRVAPRSYPPWTDRRYRAGIRPGRVKSRRAFLGRSARLPPGSSRRRLIPTTPRSLGRPARASRRAGARRPSAAPTAHRSSQRAEQPARDLQLAPGPPPVGALENPGVSGVSLARPRGFEPLTFGSVDRPGIGSKPLARAPKVTLRTFSAPTSAARAPLAPALPQPPRALPGYASSDGACGGSSIRVSWPCAR
jgi:hypothetical protein